MSSGIIIQARLDSSRLCHKVLREINGKTVLAHVIDAALASCWKQTVILTTPDLALRDYGDYTGGLSHVCPHLWRKDRDVLAEFENAANAYHLDEIVRLTADCPMIRAEHIDKAITAFHQQDCNIYYNGLDGADVEVFSRGALERAFREATEPIDREHVTTWMKNQLRYVVDQPILTDAALYKSLDTQEDLDYIRSVMR